MHITAADGNTPEWDEYVRDHPRASFYHLAVWREILERTFGHPTYYLMATEQGRVAGVLPLVHLKSRLFGRSLVSLPYFLSGGIVAESSQARAALLGGARSLLETTGARLLLIRQQGEALSDLACDSSKGAFHVALDPDPDKVFRRLQKQVRRQVRKAQRSGLEAEWGHHCLRDFYDVYATNMRDLGVPVHGLRFFATVLEYLPESAHVFVVRHDTQPVAGQFLFTYRDRVMLVCAGSLRSHLALCPNHLLYWESLRYGCENGFRICDFGRSPKGTGPYVFKSQWSGVEQEYPTYYLDADGQAMSRVSAANSRYGLARRVWQQLPVGVTKLVGPHIVKSLP